MGGINYYKYTYYILTISLLFNSLKDYHKVTLKTERTGKTSFDLTSLHLSLHLTSSFHLLLFHFTSHLDQPLLPSNL
jgi:hypothetical protein